VITPVNRSCAGSAGNHCGFNLQLGKHFKDVWLGFMSKMRRRRNA